MLEIREVSNKKELQLFVEFPFTLYKGNAYWVPPVKSDEMKQLQPETNPAYLTCDARFWTCWEDGNCVGRIGAVINHDYNKKTNSKLGRITRIEFIDKPDVSDKLFDVAENWLRENGMTAVHGPLGFNNLDNQGLLIDGFDHLPSIASVYHFPYYQNHFDRRVYFK
jgi:hypothetical protein